jgi:hypothetical protein
VPAANTDTPKVNLFDGTGIVGENDGVAPGQLVGGPGYEDEIRELGRHSFLVNYSAPECLVPSDYGEDEEEAVFDRYYFPVDGAEPVLVDLVPGGSDHERAQQESDRHCARKRDCCESRGITYMVVVGSSW